MNDLKKYVFIIVSLLVFCIVMLSCSGDEKGFTNEPSNNVEKITNVEICTLKKQLYLDVLQLTGTAEPLKTVVVSSEESGKVTYLKIQEGDRVRENDILLKQDTDLLALQLKVAESNYSLAETNYMRIKKLFDRGSTSSQEMQTATVNRDVALAQLNLAKLHYDRAIIRSPLTGTIVEKYVEFGEMLAPGTPVCKIIDTSTIKIITGIPEKELLNFMVGEPVKIKFDVYPSKVFQGNISYVGAAGNKLTSTFPLEIIYDNADDLVKPGMIARLKLTRHTYPEGIVVPQAAIIDREEKKYVFIEDNGIAREVQVEIGPVNHEKIIVFKGLEEGQNLIVVGHRDLVDGEKVNVVNNSNSTLNTIPLDR